MAAMTPRRRVGEPLRALFAAFMPHAEGMPAREAFAAMEQQITLTAFQRDCPIPVAQPRDLVARLREESWHDLRQPEAHYREIPPLSRLSGLLDACPIVRGSRRGVAELG